MTSTQQLFIRLIRLAFCPESTQIESDDALSGLTAEEWNNILFLSQINFMEALIERSLRRIVAVPETVRKAFQDAAVRRFARETQQQYWLEYICTLLEQNEIGFAVLKGGVLKRDYPEPYLRYMTDVDFYIRPEDRSVVRVLLEQNGGRFRGTESGDEQFSFSETVSMEFHGRLLYRKGKRGVESYPDWSMVIPGQNRLSEEGYALNLIGHAVGDLAKAGPGIRYILDLWVYRNRHQPQPNWEYVFSRLSQDGLSEAAGNLLALSEMLFGDGEPSPLLEEMAEYILQGGLYGVRSRGLASEAADSGGKGKAVFRQIFRNREDYYNRFPWLRRFPFLLPAAWVIRIVRSLRQHRGKIRKWRAGMHSLQKDQIRTQKEQLKRFGL